MYNLAHRQLMLLWCIGFISVVTAVSDEKPNSTTTTQGRSARYGFFDNLNSNHPYDPDYMNRYNDQSNLHSEYGNNIYSNPNYHYPSGFNYFPSSEQDYASGYGGYYLAHPKKGNPNYFLEKEDEEKDKPESNSDANDGTSKVQDMVTKGMKVLTGSENIETEVIERPASFMSTVQKFFANPMVLLAVLAIPLSFLAVMILPYFNNNSSNLLGNIGTSVLPAVTNTIATGFARSLDGNSSLQVEQILDAINEYGAKSLEDPRCFQRFLCDAANSHIESRSGGSWSIQKVIQRLSKAVDDRLWNAMGVKFLFDSVLNGSCQSLVCNGTPAYRQDFPLMDKFRLLGARLLNYTEIVH